MGSWRDFVKMKEFLGYGSIFNTHMNIMKKIKENRLITVGTIVVIVFLVAGSIVYKNVHKKVDVVTAPRTIENKIAPLDLSTQVIVSSAARPGTLYYTLGNLSYGLKEPKTKFTNGFFVGQFANCGSTACIPGQTYYSHMKVEDRIATGDLNGDGADDAVVVVGSMTNTSPNVEKTDVYTTEVVAALIKEGDTYKNVATINLLGRLQAKTASIKSISIKNGVIYVSIDKDEGSTDPDFPPSVQNVRLRFDSTSSNGFSLTI